VQRWEPGEQVSWEHGDGSADLVTVVRDDDESLVVWAPAREGGDGLDSVRIHPVNGWWSVWVLLEPGTGTHRGYLVDLTDPHTRGDHTTSTRDRVLDVWVEPDRTHERRGAEDLERAVREGRYNRDEVELITGIASMAEAAVDEGGTPFDDGWETFRPDPAWA